MAKEKMPHAKDWKNRPIDKWNATTFHAYLADLSYQKLNVTYVPFRGWGAEARLIKLNIEEIGQEKVKKLIDDAFNEYKPTQAYPGLSFGFIQTHMKGRLLNRIENAQIQKEKTIKSKEKVNTQIDELEIDWI